MLIFDIRAEPVLGRCSELLLCPPSHAPKVGPKLGHAAHPPPSETRRSAPRLLPNEVVAVYIHMHSTRDDVNETIFSRDLDTKKSGRAGPVPRPVCDRAFVIPMSPNLWRVVEACGLATWQP